MWRYDSSNRHVAAILLHDTNLDHSLRRGLTLGVVSSKTICTSRRPIFTMTIQRIKPGPRMSGAVVHGNTVYLAGQVAQNAAGKSVGDQTKDILSIIDGCWQRPAPTRRSC